MVSSEAVWYSPSPVGQDVEVDEAVGLDRRGYK